ncbi:MAG TPA: asparagine synthase (glutamine-hydrolyzing) [Anaerolineales bacterium]|nr:asparagine synthase (glutamine-hydrolyzing) [Anaerolineales bacterium]
MCGITGFWELPGLTAEELSERSGRMAAALAHRGPDDQDTWVDAKAGIAFGFRRLAILDLSPEGRQPMISACGRYVLVFNGEIYNFQELRRELQARGHTFRGRSDTEVMLAAFTEWGLEAALPRFIGMFAFALWDRAKRQLCLARDRLGIKPLYYGWAGQTLLFASELKALHMHPAFQGEVDRNSLALMMRYNVVPAPHSIYRGIHQLLPGCVLRLDSPLPTNREPHPYWTLEAAVERGQADPFHGSETEAVERLDFLLREAVRLRMIADVPLGAFLSGGIDSTSVVALMQAQSPLPVRTFTIGFHDLGYDEAAHARQVAKRLHTEHTELYLTPQDALDIIPRLPEIYDEPFADWSQIPTYLLSHLTRQHVTVSLSGDGGDELFAGYNHYFSLDTAVRRMRMLPPRLRRSLSSQLIEFSASQAARWMDAVFPRRGRIGRREAPSRRLGKIGLVLGLETPGDLYSWAVSHWRQPHELVLGADQTKGNLNGAREFQAREEFLHWMMYTETRGYLPNDILAKIDRASMAVGLEARVPLLDHRVVEFAWRLPLSMKVRQGQGKWILRQVLGRYLPLSLVERPKQGFSLPLASWLRGPLRDWAESMLAESRLSQEGYLNPGLVRTKWAEHLSGQQDWLRSLWNVLMFQAWNEHWAR